MNVSALDIVTALQVISQAALTAQQVGDLLNKPDLTEADVQAVLDQTDAIIDRVRADD
jgi:hypothetical protein